MASSPAVTLRARRTPTWLPMSPTIGGPARKATYPIGRHDADASGGVTSLVGRGAHTDGEAERCAQAPKNGADHGGHEVGPEHHNQQANQGTGCRGPQDGDTAEAVQDLRAYQRPMVIEATKTT
jgi:hypothetical protein